MSLEDSLIFVLERAMAGFPYYFTKATTVTVYNYFRTGVMMLRMLTNAPDFSIKLDMLRIGLEVSRNVHAEVSAIRSG